MIKKLCFTETELLKFQFGNKSSNNVFNDIHYLPPFTGYNEIELTKNIVIGDIDIVTKLIKLNCKTLEEIIVKDYDLRVALCDWFYKNKIQFNNSIYSESIVTSSFMISHKPGYPDIEWKFLNEC